MHPSLLVLVFSLFSQSWAQDPVRPYPLPDAYLSQTSILNHSSYLTSLDDSQWYLDNIPFIDFPDKTAQDVYYYRTSVLKRHLKYVHEGQGWVFTEFIHPVAWASKYQTIPDSAPHHLVEARWLRNPNYIKDTIQLYTRTGVESQTGITYTHYMQDAILEHAETTGDVNFLTSQLDGMIKMWGLWDVQLNTTVGLYHRTPLSDAQEFSLPNYVVGGPGGGPVQVWNASDNDYSIIWVGPETYRPSFNAYMIANSRAISTVAQLAGNNSLAQQWNTTSATLYSNMQKVLWNDEIQFWIDVVAQSNVPAVGRELIGYYPFRFDIGTDDQYVKGLETGLTSEGFLTDFGPTTLEQSNEYYTAMKNLSYCCLWQGQSWPFSTSVYLGTLARIARENRSSIITPELFQDAFSTYTRTNYDDGGQVPFTGEAHYPTVDAWSGYTMNHSEHYLHSTYLDNVFTNLIGIVPTLDNRLELQPLVPTNWTHFAVENLPYHGSLFSMIWDANGTSYSNFNHSTGLSIYQNGKLIHTQPNLSAVNVTLSNDTQAIASLASQSIYSNILANPNAPWGYPNVSADYSFNAGGDMSSTLPYRMNDGLLWYDTVPDNRWTNNQSWTPFQTVTLSLPRARTFNSVSLGIYDDSAAGGSVACPTSIQILSKNGSVVAERDPWSCKPNALNTILFDSPSPDLTNVSTPATGLNVTTDHLEIFMTSRLGYGLGISEIQIWVPESTGPRYEMEDAVLGTFIGGFEGRATGLNATIYDQGVLFGPGGWAELANVKAGQVGTTSMTILGGGNGSVVVGMNYLANSSTVQFSGNSSETIDVDFLPGGNVVTIFQTGGTPWVDAVVVG